MPDTDPLIDPYVGIPVTIEARNPYTGVLQAELPYTRASWSDILGQAGGWDATLPLDDLVSTDYVEPNATAVYFTRGARALFGGIVDRRSVDTEKRTVRIAGKGFLDYLTRRAIYGRNGMTYAATTGSVSEIGWSAVDQFRIVQDVLDHLAQYPGNLAFTVARTPTLSGVTRTKTAFYGTERKRAGALINEFAKLDDGFDVSVSFPTYDPTTGPTRQLDLAYPRRGRLLDTILEHGRNSTILTDESDGARMGNPVTILGAGTGDAITYAEDVDTSLIAPVGRYLRQDLDVALKDVSDYNLLSARAWATLSAYKTPVRTLEIGVVESGDFLVGSYAPGDSVPVMVDDAALNLYDTFRIVKVNPTLTPEGWVTVKISLALAGASLGDA